MSESEVNTPLLYQAISQTLGIEIIDGTWAVNTARTLESIQERFSVSRTVAREASRQLEAMGLVSARRRHGIVAQPIDRWMVLDVRLIDWRLRSTKRREQLLSLTQLRMAIEPAAAEYSARRASPEDRAQILPISAELRRTGEAGDLTTFMRHDIAFHRLLLQLSGNEMFAALSDVIAVVLQGRTELGLMPEKPKPEALALHDQVADAVYRGDVDAARVAMLGILDEVREAFGGSVESGSTPRASD